MHPESVIEHIPERKEQQHSDSKELVLNRWMLRPEQEGKIYEAEHNPYAGRQRKGNQKGGL